MLSLAARFEGRILAASVPTRLACLTPQIYHAPMRADRRSKLLTNLDIAALEGAEIGPLADPAVTKGDGRITYIDHLATEDLKRHYSIHGISENSITNVDVVWTGGRLRDILPGTTFDYVIASHVIEHVPDLVTWLNELSSVIKPGGSLRLAIPDKRFCFDRLRSESRLPDVLTAYFLRAQRPQVCQVVDSEFYHRLVDPVRAWKEACDTIPPPTPSDLERAFAFASRAAANEYVDVHCWTFTLKSFSEIMQSLVSLSLTDFSCGLYWDCLPDENEFFIHLVKDDANNAEKTWNVIIEEFTSESSTVTDARVRWLNEGKRLGEEQSLTENMRLLSELKARDEVIEKLVRSTSWRMTAPARFLISLLRH